MEDVELMSFFDLIWVNFSILRNDGFNLIKYPSIELFNTSVLGSNLILIIESKFKSFKGYREFFSDWVFPVLEFCNKVA